MADRYSWLSPNSANGKPFISTLIINTLSFLPSFLFLLLIKHLYHWHFVYLSFKFYLLYFYVIWCFAFMLCLCTTWGMLGGPGGQNRVSDPQELDLQTAVSCPVGARSQNPVLWEQPALWSVSSAPLYFFNTWSDASWFHSNIFGSDFKSHR